MEKIERLLGRKAYEAYCESVGWKSAVSGASLPQFSSTSDLIRAGWIKAALAVLRHSRQWDKDVVDEVLVRQLLNYEPAGSRRME